MSEGNEATGSTALERFARLETVALWRPGQGAQRREVVVSFGEATLVITDMAGRPLSHWSLPAIGRRNPGQRPALYSPDPEGSETLEIADDTMIGAIETVRRALGRRRPHPGRLRVMSSLAALAALLALAVIWLPGALREQAREAVPAAKRSEIGATLLGHIQRATGPTCRSQTGTAALGRLKERVLGPAAPGQIVVIPAALRSALPLPGGIIVTARTMVEAPEDPAVVAGHILAAAEARRASDPMARLLDWAGLGPTLTLLTTGDLPPQVLADYARHLLTNVPPEPDSAALVAAFDDAEIPMAPWAATFGAADAAIAALDRTPPAPAILADGDWIALQAICRA